MKRWFGAFGIVAELTLAAMAVACAATLVLLSAAILIGTLGCA